MSHQHKSHKRQLKRLPLLFLIILFVGLLLNCGTALFPKWPVKPDEGITLTIKRGMSPAGIAGYLQQQGVVRSAFQFRLAVKWLGVSRKLQAGSYYFQGRLNNYEVIHKLTSGDVVSESITFPEGFRTNEIANLLEEKMQIPHEKFMACVRDTQLIRSLGIQAGTLEGYLFPETYRFHADATPEEIVRTMVGQWKKVFTDSLIQIADRMGFTPHDVMTLASIVEGEAVHDSERAVIAAIYLNRLRKGMYLQACPTVQYLLPDGPRHLLKQDLEIDSPYNTYKHTGLPPGPINNPGLKSILAVLNPAPVDYLYLVANGDGTHTFSRNINDHIRAKHKFDMIRRYYRQ